MPQPHSIRRDLFIGTSPGENGYPERLRFGLDCNSGEPAVFNLTRIGVGRLPELDSVFFRLKELLRNFDRQSLRLRRGAIDMAIEIIDVLFVDPDFGTQLAALQRLADAVARAFELNDRDRHAGHIRHGVQAKAPRETHALRSRGDDRRDY